MRPIFYLCLALFLSLLQGCQEPSTSNSLPTITLTAPSDGAVFKLGEAVTLEASASDRDGTVTEVDFLVAGQLVGRSSTAPYSYTFVPSEVGSTLLGVTARDNRGAEATDGIAIFVEDVAGEAFEVEVNVSGQGRVLSQPRGIDCPTVCTAEFDKGTTVTLSAQPGSGYSFASWEGGCTATPCVVEEASTVTASFSAATTTLTLSPESVTLGTGQAQVFSASVSGPNSEVTWSVSGGAITSGSSASYTAPARVGDYTVTATSVGDPSKTATATVTVKADVQKRFSIVALPDTQNYVCVGDTGNGCGGTGSIYKDGFVAQTQWIIDNLDKEAIAFVTHEGDVVDNASKKIEYDHAEEAMGKLDGRVPYSVAMGDHDYYPEQHHDGATLFTNYYGAARYKAYEWYGGAGPREYSHYQLFTAGGVEFLHIALEWEAPSDAVAWAQALLDQYSTTPTIITTHAYLRDGQEQGHSTVNQSCIDTVGVCDRANDPDAATGRDLYYALAVPNEQVFMVLNGHYHFNGRDGGCSGGPLACDNGEYHRASQNLAGSRVYEMLANYQDYPNGGDGWLRIIRFLPGGGYNGLDRIKVDTYSPTLNQYQSGPASDFFFDLDFEERFDFAGE